MKSNQNIVIKVVAGFISRKYMIFVVFYSCLLSYACLKLCFFFTDHNIRWKYVGQLRMHIKCINKRNKYILRKILSVIIYL